MYHFEDAYPLLFRQIELFKILVYESRLRHRELLKKGNIMRKFETGDLLVVRKQVKSIIKYGIAHKLLFKKKGTIQSPREGYTKIILDSVFAFL